jgi:hypothetical protein
MRSTLLLVLAVVLGTGGTAAAAEPGVTYDPTSPAGKEYALPLEAARGALAGGQHGSNRPPLFGAGIKRAVPPGVSVQDHAPAKPVDQQTARHLKNNREVAQADSASPLRPLSPGSQASGGTRAATAATVAAAALVLALMLGLGWRVARNVR